MIGAIGIGKSMLSVNLVARFHAEIINSLKSKWVCRKSPNSRYCSYSQEPCSLLTPPNVTNIDIQGSNPPSPNYWIIQKRRKNYSYRWECHVVRTKYWVFIDLAIIITSTIKNLVFFFCCKFCWVLTRASSTFKQVRQ